MGNEWGNEEQKKGISVQMVIVFCAIAIVISSGVMFQVGKKTIMKKLELNKEEMCSTELTRLGYTCTKNEGINPNPVVPINVVGADNNATG